MTLYDQPDLAKFVQEHGTPYDPETDTYRRPPFAQPVKAKRSGTIYNAHTYHTKVPPEGIVPYIEHYTNPGDLVLDPFCGSGMTGVAALMTGRHAILSDLSPAAVHIASNYCTPMNVKALQREFEHIRKAVEEEFNWLYGTTCDRCKGPATIHYTIWSDVFKCGRCGAEIVMWDSAVDLEAGQVSETFLCPSCRKEWEKSQVQWLKQVPVVTNYECSRCVPKRAEHRTTGEEVHRIAEIEASEIPYWYPRTQLDTNSEMYIRSALHLRDIRGVDDFYTARNLHAVAKLWSLVQNVEAPLVKARLQFVFTAIALAHATIMSRVIFKKTGKVVLTSHQTGTLYVPSLSVEKNVWEAYSRKYSTILGAAKQIQHGRGAVQVSTQSATDLSQIAGSSTDYVFTDPPFGANIFYADLNFVWESWLGIFTDDTKEAVVNRSKKNGKTIDDYTQLMTEAFGEIRRVLKPGRWASVVFHNSDDRIWQAILDSANASGLELVEINAFDKVQLSYKGARGDKGLERVTNQDIVLNLLKPHPGRAPAPNGRTHLVEAEQRVVETVAGFLETNPPPGQRTLQHLWNHVLYDLLRDGSVQVSMADVEAMLAYHSQTFKLVDGRYYLRGEAVLGGNVFDLSSDAGAIAWLTAVLGNESQTIGELIPKWQQETASLGGVDPGRLDRVLEQNFWQDSRTGRWRVPTAAEREKMSARADLGAQAHLRVVRRFLDGDPSSGSGRAPDRQPNDWELCAWIRFCYNREFYAEAAALFPHVVEARVNPDEYREIKRIVAVCRMRAGQSKK
jgi:16S rRNA G966 N2-methylase RsmD/DNA-directed RNA polymerase subunit RPC12/RpoP